MTDRDPRVATREPMEVRGGRLGRLVTGLLRGGAVAVVAGGLLVACGGDDDSDGGDGDAAAGAPAGGSEAEAEAEAEAGSPTGGADDDGRVGTIEDFCSAIGGIDVQLDARGWFETTEDGDVGPALEAVGSIPPPGAIMDDWATVLGGTEQAAEAERDGGDVDGTDETETAAERVRSYVDVRCSVDLGSS